MMMVRARRSAHEHGGKRASDSGMRHVENRVRHPRETEELLDSKGGMNLRISHVY